MECQTVYGQCTRMYEVFQCEAIAHIMNVETYLLQVRIKKMDHRVLDRWTLPH